MRRRNLMQPTNLHISQARELVERNLFMPSYVYACNTLTTVTKMNLYERQRNENERFLNEICEIETQVLSPINFTLYVYLYLYFK